MDEPWCPGASASVRVAEMRRYPTDMEVTPNIRQQVRLYISEIQTFLRDHSGLLLSVITAQIFSTGALNGALKSTT
jgi:hypothetical protein